ncbi:MAG: Dolichyl-phosphate-mannose-protein mannosyltransferase [Blastocatellia bacterium]|nr:Dolichyl-phosphate-mannose-protein mannosyltransferase [Blastocatellia bacterium]
MSDKVQLARSQEVEAGRTSAHKAGMLSSWRWWLPPAALALIFILIFVDPFIGDWDALEYTLNALHGTPSSMALGRGLFIFFNHALYVIAHAVFHLQPQQAYLLFKYAVVAQGPLVVIACWILTRDLSGSKQAATVAALLVTFSPAVVIYSGQVMTDVPALLLTTVALIIHLRGLQQRRVWLVIVGAALLGAGVNLRETVGFYAPWLVFAPFVCGWRPNRRGVLLVVWSCLVFLIFAGAGFAYWFLFDPNYRAAWYGWRESMRVETALHPVRIRNVWPWLLYFLATSSLVLFTLPMAFVSEWRRRRVSPILLLAAVGLLANLLLLLNYSTTIGWRYLSTGLPAMVPLCSHYLFRSLSKRLGTGRRAFTVTAAAIALIGFSFGVYLWPVRSATVAVREAAKEYDRELVKVPRDAVMISGAQSVAVIYWRGIGAGEWEVIGPGAGWPQGRLDQTIADYLKSGRRVFLDVDPRWWQPCGWHVSEVNELVSIEPRFHFRKVSPTVYEIRPNDDPSATDQPHLEKLLPVNRPDEVKRCFNSA